MIKAVIFDAGGVLHSSESKHIQADIVATLGITDDQFLKSRETLRPLFLTGKITEDEFWKRFIDLTNAPLPLPQGESLWKREFKKWHRIHEDVMKVVDQLKQLQLKVAVLSNSIISHSAVNQELGVYAPFPLVVLSYEVGMQKPDSEIYLYTLNKLGVKPEEAVFVDDLEENVLAARNVGMKGIVFENCEQMEQELSQLGIALSL